MLAALVSLLVVCVAAVAVFVLTSQGHHTVNPTVTDHTKTVVHTVTNHGSSTHSTSTPTRTANTVSTQTASTSTSDLSMTRYKASTYSINHPSDWSTVQDNVRSGNGYQSKFVDPSNQNVYLLVDYTPGYSGPVERAAAPVRASVASGSTYQQITWGPGAQNQWVWQFTAQGLEQVDTFSVACDTGYAVLGSTPTGMFSQYASLFQSLTNSFTPNCQ